MTERDQLLALLERLVEAFERIAENTGDLVVILADSNGLSLADEGEDEDEEEAP